MLYADDAGVVSQSAVKLSKIMEMIVIVYVAFGLTVSEDMADTMCFRTTWMPESTAIFSVEAVGHVYKETREFVYLGRDIKHDAKLSIEI